MDFTASIEEYLKAHKRAIDALDREPLDGFLRLMVEALENGRSIFIFGNGGSAAAASHFAVDIGKGASRTAEKRFKIHCLNDNVPTMLAYGNDVGFEEIFVEPLRNLLEPDDLVIAISGSGNSENVIRAATYARETGARVVGICGFDGGRLKGLSDVAIHLAIDDMQLAEDVQTVVTHVALKALCDYQGIRDAY